MNWLNKLERKFGRYAIPNIMYYIMILYAAGFILMKMNPSFYYSLLALDPAKVMQGQIWRLVTFLIQPPSTDFLYFLLYMYMYYILGVQLERAWGSFTFDLYILIGVLGHILGAMAVYWVTGYNGAPYYYDLSYLYMSLFLGFAATFPNAQFLLFFIVPVKAKWLAIIDVVYFGYGVLTGSMATKIVVLLSLANFLIFFFSMGKTRFSGRARGAAFRKKVVQAAPKRNTVIARHRCAVCGRTELDDPNLEFRFCSQCEGSYEYCTEHLYTHKHVRIHP